MADLRPSSLRLDTVSGAGKSVVIVRGDIDAATAPQLEALVDGLLDDRWQAKRPSEIVAGANGNDADDDIAPRDRR